MLPVKATWASVQGNPTFMRRVNGWLTIFWLAMIPVSYAMHWLSSVVYVSALSLWALVAGHWSSWRPLSWGGAGTGDCAATRKPGRGQGGREDHRRHRDRAGA